MVSPSITTPFFLVSTTVASTPFPWPRLLSIGSSYCGTHTHTCTRVGKTKLTHKKTAKHWVSALPMALAHQCGMPVFFSSLFSFNHAELLGDSKQPSLQKTSLRCSGRRELQCMSHFTKKIFVHPRCIQGWVYPASHKQELCKNMKLWPAAPHQLMLFNSFPC